jgi:putative phage-type endonuclease
MHPTVEFLLKKTYDDQRTPAWHALRGTMLTASDLATAIGDNPYETPDDLLVKKCGHNKWNGNAATAHGTLLEPIARDLYDDRHNQKSHEIGLVQHSVHKWLGGSPDGVTESGRLIEIKCPLSRKITPAVPKYYLPQIQLLLEVLDLEVCDFIQYRPGPPEEFVVTEVERDREWFERILPKAQRFWNLVLEKRQTGLCEIVDDAYTPVCEIIDEILDDDRGL